ncbi:Cullin protein, neddylation domain,Winged helix-turn-helix DNA-binding domain,Cullin, conserved site [Cinara cedri]|uniref:Cullin protein, neddylation domain,Winged helix-turn-helix DNA-binding domain,Cullin, conserved site n=1 Tax=Cinara cedri TaxID=506608 RepID=A0A5E4MFK0_9HEMI|nr:Cullin protein, neddylation domain,Winged helix-turn-helix DNA-binding domain,Cullin, conserved site [Cinara cedri]
MNKTDINEKDLIRALQPLVMGNLSQRVIIRIPKSIEIEPHHEFSINKLYTSKLSCVMIYSTTTEEENRLEYQKTKDKVEENKNNQIDTIAALIHIMKARKKLTHNTLIMEVIGKLKCRFMPSPMLILNRIEYLIQKEYLSRTPEKINTYIYVA